MAPERSHCGIAEVRRASRDGGRSAGAGQVQPEAGGQVEVLQGNFVEYQKCDKRLGTGGVGDKGVNPAYAMWRYAGFHDDRSCVRLVFFLPSSSLEHSHM